ncbi:hypothetical protein BDC45DRAFT_182777 [Circinella umbellata]|nr:hypothetical protein BDC45DRAFT_182777 [Circinella umbellata]
MLIQILLLLPPTIAIIVIITPPPPLPLITTTTIIIIIHDLNNNSYSHFQKSTQSNPSIHSIPSHFLLPFFIAFEPSVYNIFLYCTFVHLFFYFWITIIKTSALTFF